MQDSVYTDLIKKANSIFGPLHWSHKVVNQTIDFVNRKTNSFTVGCSTIVKVQHESGRYHQDFGYSESIAQTEGLATFKARSSSCTNALRRTLMAFEEMATPITGNPPSSSTSNESGNGNSENQSGPSRNIDLQYNEQKRRRLIKQKELQKLWKSHRLTND